MGKPPLGSKTRRQQSISEAARRAAQVHCLASIRYFRRALRYRPAGFSWMFHRRHSARFLMAESRMSGLSSTPGFYRFIAFSRPLPTPPATTAHVDDDFILP